MNGKVDNKQETDDYLIYRSGFRRTLSFQMKGQEIIKHHKDHKASYYVT